MKCVITGRKFSDTERVYTTSSERVYYYKEIDKQAWEEDFDTMEEARYWLICNHPDYYLGHNIKMENGDFAMAAIPYYDVDDMYRPNHRALVSIYKKQMEAKMNIT